MDQQAFPSPTREVERLWAAVFRVSAGVIVHAKKFGFSGMSDMTPNIHDIMMYITFVESAIDALSNDKDAEYEDIRLLLNSKRQMTTLKFVAKALDQGDYQAFEKAMHELETQAAF
jgi:hypothetical protein